jgi:hypothetical protein
MKQDRVKKSNVLQVSTLEQLKVLVSEKTRAKIILGGELVLASLSNYAPGADYVKQEPRKVGQFSLFSRGEKNLLQVWLVKEAVSLMSKAGARLTSTLALDYYLRFGLKRKEPEFILFSGDICDDKIILLAFHFKKGALVRLSELALPSDKGSRLREDALPIVEQFRTDNPNVPLFWSAPLPDLNEPGVTNVGPEIFFGRKVQKVSASGGASLLARYGAATAMVLTGMAGYAVAVGYPYLNYQREAATFEKESTQLKGDFEFAANRLKIVQNHKTFMSQTPEKLRKVNALEQMLVAIAEDAYPLREAAVRVKKDNKPNETRVYDMEITLELPKDAQITAIDQAAPALSRLSEQMASPMHLAKLQGFQDVEAVKGHPTRIYKIEGDINAAKAN